MIGTIGKFLAALGVALFIALIATLLANALTRPHLQGEHAVPIEVASTATVSDVQVEEPVSIETLLIDADEAVGKKLSRSCVACHSFDRGGDHRIGPNLWNIVNAKKAHASDYTYSEALNTKGGVWDYSSLDEFLTKPMAYIPGTKMGFLGIKDPEERAALIKWLRSLSDSPAALPSSDVEK